MLTLALAIVVLLILSAFFSGSETALTAVSTPMMHQMEQKGSRRAGSGPSSRPRAADGSMGRTPPATDWERT